MHRVVFIDESPSDIRRFQRYVKKTRDALVEGVEIVPVTPPSALEELISELHELKPDAIITDFRLNEYKPDVTYNGVDVVKSFLNHREHFPCFVLTSFDDDAVKESEDVNLIYIKGIMGNGEENVKITFLERVEEQIRHYKTRVKEAEAELLALIARSTKQALSLPERERIIFLDSFIEKALSKKHHIPSSAKVEDFIGNIEKLVANTDKLIEKLNPEK